MELQRETIHAVAQSGRLRTIVEHVSEVAAAATAMHFDALHPEGAVLARADRIRKRLIEARPSGAALELGFGGKQRQVTSGAGERTLAVLPEQRAGPRPLGAFLAQDFILL